VERRDRALDDGLEWLVDEVAARSEEPPAELTAALLRASGASSHRDDACALAVSISPG
jgi:hypothetical protein